MPNRIGGPVTRYAAFLTSAALMTATLSCGEGSEGAGAVFPRRRQPLLLAELSGLDPYMALPRSLALRGEDVAHARLAPTGFAADTLGLAGALARDAMRNNYLCLLVDLDPPQPAAPDGGRSNIILRSLDSGVAVSPPEVATEVVDSVWAGWHGRQETVASLMDKYRPDVLIMRLRPESPGQVQYLMEAWEGRGLDLVLYSPPRPEADYRGWAVLRGPSFLGGRMDGLTLPGLHATLRTVLGVEDTLRAAEGTAAYGHLTGGTR
jgi:hypothetical protein